MRHVEAEPLRLEVVLRCGAGAVTGLHRRRERRLAARAGQVAPEGCYRVRLAVIVGALRLRVPTRFVQKYTVRARLDPVEEALDFGPPCRRAVKTTREPFRAAELPARGPGPRGVRSEIRSCSTAASSTKSVVTTFVWVLLLPST